MIATRKAPEFALHWASQLGEHPDSLERLHGGINSLVFRCGSGAKKWVIKGYPALKVGKRDGMEAEKQFLEFAGQVAPEFTPTLVYADQERRCVVLENIDGEHFCEGVPAPNEAVEAAVQFMRLLNSQRELASRVITIEAAEGFLALSSHMANIRERLASMTSRHIRIDIQKKAETLIEKVQAEADSVENDTSNAIREGSATDKISHSMRCVSPSDFGFHNAILTSSGIRFIDFEFAGWDDPAKTNIDFILQPRVPILSEELPLLGAWDQMLQESIKLRCRYLAPILRLKWICIILGVLNPMRHSQLMRTRSDREMEHLVNKRLQRAEDYMRKRCSHIY